MKTLRDEFAIAALTGILDATTPQSPEIVADRCYAIADAMMTEREKSPRNDDILGHGDKVKLLRQTTGRDILTVRNTLIKSGWDFAEALRSLSPHSLDVAVGDPIVFVDSRMEHREGDMEKYLAMPSCEECGGPHDLNQCPTSMGRTHRQIITEKQPECFLCGQSPDEPLHDPARGSHLFAVPHDFIGRCATCRGLESEKQHRHPVAHDSYEFACTFKPSGLCFICNQAEAHEIHPQQPKGETDATTTQS